MGDEALVALLGNIPNLAIAIWVIWADRQTIKVLLANQEALIRQLMSLHPPQAADNVPTYSAQEKERTEKETRPD